MTTISTHPLLVGLVLMVLTSCQAGPAPASPAHDDEPVDGARLWSRNCSTCHGTVGAGDGPLAAGNGAPSLVGPGANERVTEALIEEMIRNGRRGMPAFRHLHDAEVQALVAHVRALGVVAPDRPNALPTSGSGVAAPADVIPQEPATAPAPAAEGTP